MVGSLGYWQTCIGLARLGKAQRQRGSYAHISLARVRIYIDASQNMFYNAMWRMAPNTALLTDALHSALRAPRGAAKREL